MLLRDKEKRNAMRRELFEKLESSGESISATVKKLRKMLMKDQTQFAEYVGISVFTLRKIEQNKGNVEIDSLKAILDKFSLELVVKRKG